MTDKMEETIDYAPLKTNIDTVGDLRKFLGEFDDDMLVRVNDDGATFTLRPRRKKWNDGTIYLEL